MSCLKIFLFASLLPTALSLTPGADRVHADGQRPAAVYLELTNEWTSKSEAPIKGEGEVCTQYLKVRLTPAKRAQKQNEVWNMRIESWKLDQKRFGDGNTVRLHLPWNNNKKKSDVLRNITSTEIPVYLQTDGSIKKVDRPQAFDKIADVPEEARPHLMALLAEQYLVALANVALQKFPKDLAAVKQGESWTKKSKTVLPRGGVINDGSFLYVTKYTVDKIAGTLVRLQVVTTLEHVAGEKQGEPLRFMAQVTKVQSKGTMVVDRITQRMIFCDSPLRAVGTWQVNAGTQKVTGNFLVFSRLRLDAKSR